MERFKGGKSLGVTEEGSPYRFDPDHGMPMLAGDGGLRPWGRVLTYDITRASASGGVECVERVVVLPGAMAAGPAKAWPPRVHSALVTDEEVAADRAGRARYEVVVYLQEEREWTIPSLAVSGHAMRYRGDDQAADLRQELLARRAASRTRIGEDVARWIERLGGEVHARMFHGLNALRCSAHADTLARLVDHPDVRDVERSRTRSRGTADAPSRHYLCHGDERFRDWDMDSAVCGGEFAGYLDARLAAVNAYAYLDVGYHGAGEGAEEALGASWASSLEPGWDGAVPHLTLGIVETAATLYTTHPAFLNQVSGESRIRLLQGALPVIPTGENDPDHPINLAGVALGNITDGQDSHHTDATSQDARSGVARRAMGVFSWAPIDTTLADLADGNLVDVVLQAETLNTGEGEGECPTEEEARGIDANSQAVVEAFLDHAMFYVKSAGNMRGDGRSCDVDTEVSAPGAAATALVVGNMDVQGFTAQGMQVVNAIQENSAEGPTGDGRTYPSLVAPGWGCGVPYSWYDLPADSSTLGPYYDQFSGSSGASATVAGCVLLFKHWYLAKFPSYANIAGRIMSNILNMADGYVGTYPAAPAVGWGLGRFRLRLYDEGGMGGQWARATTRVDIKDGEVEVLDLGSIVNDGPDSSGYVGPGGVPVGTDRLRVTLWWLEPNTGEREEKANIMAILSYTHADGSLGRSTVATGGDNVLRLQFDTSVFPLVPTGQVLLTLIGVVPPAERYFSGSKRTLYVSWFWESGRDLSLISGCASGSAEDAMADARAGLLLTAADARAQQEPGPPSTPVLDHFPISRAEAQGLLDAVERRIRDLAPTPAQGYSVGSSPGTTLHNPPFGTSTQGGQG